MRLACHASAKSRALSKPKSSGCCEARSEAWFAVVASQVYLSEMVREFMLKYVSRAQKVVPPGIKHGQVSWSGVCE